MASFSKSDMIKEMRIRKKWQQMRLLELEGKPGKYSVWNLSRVENNRQTPYMGTYTKLMDTMEIPIRDFFCPYLENATTKIINMKEQLLYELDYAPFFPSAMAAAEEILENMSALKGFDSGINKQFILSCRARLYDLQGKDPVEILRLTKQGLNITYPEFDPLAFEGDVLLLYEPQLVHIQARAYAKIGRIGIAINLLQYVQTGLRRLPQDDKEKERLLAPVLFDLTQFLVESGQPEKAPIVCTLGIQMSNERNKGKYTPDFMLARFYLMRKINPKRAKPETLIPIYFGYCALRKMEQARQVRELAKSFGIEFETYGAEKLQSYKPEFILEHGEPIACGNFGELIRGMRDAAGMTLDELCEGICSVSTLNRIETNKIQGNVYYLEAFMQRMGRDIDKYFNTFISQRDFNNKQKRDELNMLLSDSRYDEAKKLVKELEVKGSFKNGVNLQFIRSAEAEIYGGKRGYCYGYLGMLKDALEITQKDIDEKNIAKTRLTSNEIFILNQMAINMCEKKERTRGMRILKSLLENLKFFYVDETERIHMYLAILYNYSKYLGQERNYKQSLELAIEGEELCIKYGNLKLLSFFAANIAFNMLELGDKEGNVPYFALNYYISDLLGKTQTQEATWKYVKERLGISFS